jgi:hypothetical protein
MYEKLEKKALIPPSKSSWFSWIPTNIGYLNFNYIADERSLISVFGERNFELKKNSNIEKEIKLFNTNLSDLNSTVKTLLSKEEIPCIAEIKFVNESTFNPSLNRSQPYSITGYCNLSYINIENKLLMKVNSDFEIESNGKIEIKNIEISYSNDVDDIDLNKNNTMINTIVNAIYTLIKKISHGDNHHFQKIDTMIGVYTEFIPEQILTDLGFQIKRIDKFVKSNENSVFAVLYQQDKSSADIVASGFMSYISTFYELFLKNSNLIKQPLFKEANKVLNNKNEIRYIKYENIINTIESIKAGVQKHKQALEKKKNTLGFLISMFALVAAYNILFSNLIWQNETTTTSVISTFLISHLSRDAVIVLIGIIIFSLAINNYISNYSINLFRKAMSNPSKYTFIEVLILYKYIKTNNIEKEILEIERNKDSIKIIEDHINEYINLIFYIAIVCLVSFILSFIGFQIISLIPIVIYIIFLFYKLFKFRKIHSAK